MGGGAKEPVSERDSAPDRVRYEKLPEEIRHPNLVRLYRHWDEMRRGRAMPSRADVDPLNLPALLGNLILIDVLREPLRFRYRLIGSRLTERVKRDMTGKFFDEVPEPVYRARLYEWHGGCVDEKVPRAAVTARRLLDRWEPYEILTVPLSTDGTLVDMTLTGIYYRDA
ncbi:MAG: PAS domain-containing protein [Alphaproteobacteria bacterium]|nr:PAS domain-containing protein [Alphaproteobacteria bacterium]